MKLKEFLYIITLYDGVLVVISLVSERDPVDLLVLIPHSMDLSSQIPIEHGTSLL